MTYDSDVVVGATGSSEIIIPKTALAQNEQGLYVLDCEMLLRGSYNYHANGVRHYTADVIPSVVYCHCIKEEKPVVADQSELQPIPL